MQKDLVTTRCSDAEPASPTAPSVKRRPIRVFYSALTHRFYASAHYRSLPSGLVEITGKKFDVTDDIAFAVIEYEIKFAEETAPQPERVSPGSARNTDAPLQNTADPEGSA